MQSSLTAQAGTGNGIRGHSAGALAPNLDPPSSFRDFEQYMQRATSPEGPSEHPALRHEPSQEMAVSYDAAPMKGYGAGGADEFEQRAASPRAPSEQQPLRHESCQEGVTSYGTAPVLGYQPVASGPTEASESATKELYEVDASASGDGSGDLERYHSRGSFGGERKTAWWRTRRGLAVLILFVILLGAGLGAGLGVGLKKGDSDDAVGGEAVAGYATGANGEILSDAYIITGATEIDGTVSSYTYTSFDSGTCCP